LVLELADTLSARADVPDNSLRSEIQERRCSSRNRVTLPGSEPGRAGKALQLVQPLNIAGDCADFPVGHA
jgi:hypothetical protein